MRIALACDWYLPRLGGIELHLADLARELRLRGHTVDVLTSTPAANGDEDERHVRRIATMRLPGSGVACSPALPRAMHAAIRDGGFDVVHAHASVVSPVAYAALRAARRSGIPAVVTFHSVLHAKARVLAALDTLLGWTRGRLAVTAVSGLVASQLRRAMPALDVGVLPNGIDAAAWHAPREPAARDDVGVHVVSAMRLHRKKRPAALVRALATARRLAPDANLTLTLFGDGPERASLERLVRAQGLGSVVRLAGRATRAELRDAYARADVFALPTVREAFGIAPLEARCAGLPVVAMRASGVSDFLVHGRDALLAADDLELTSHLARLARDVELRSALAAHPGVVSDFDWERVVARHLDCYERVAGAASSRCAVPSRS